jgi:serine protease Do
MSSWLIATAIVGTAAVGPFMYGQSSSLAQDVEAPRWEVPRWAEAEQAVRVLAMGGSQIGVTLRDLDAEDQKTGKVGSGVLVESVEADSPAAKAGLKANDVVVEFDGERVRSSRQFARLVQETVPGRAVQIAATRDGQRVTLTITPRESGGPFKFDRVEGAFAKVAPVPVPKSGAFPFAVYATPGQLGVTVTELPSQLAEYFGTKDGVLVTSVTDNSLAARTGVKAGDVITSLDGGSINDGADLRRRAQRLEPGDEFTLGIVRDKKPLTLKGKMESPRRTTGRTIL